MPAPYNVNLLTHLYILLYRAGKGDFDKIQAANHTSMSSSIYYPLAQKVTRNIEGYICKQLPDTETINICNYLASSRIDYPPLILLLNQPTSSCSLAISLFGDLMAT
ncbi:PRD domain-containing protein [Mitsuokella sp.]|uniref:PRD domain-containing protein n=1 Tax=Mitsuokella sp. TaxID=2049034 RepID=UPI0039C5DF3F